MINQFEHLNNGLTIIFCENTQLKSIEEVYIDTTLFNYISAFNIEWKVWDDSKNKNDGNTKPKVVGGVDLDNDKKIIFLKRLIGEYLYGKDFSYSLLNGDHLDLRQINLFKFRHGTGHSGQVRAEKAQLLQVLPALQRKNDINLIESKVDVKIVEYANKLLIIEENIVVNELSSDQKEALLNYFASTK